MKDIIINNLKESASVLDAFMNNPAKIESIEKAGQIMSDAISRGNKIISCGNGGSMCDSMHFAEELTGRFRNDRHSLPAMSISDPTHMSCVANDFGYEYIFSRVVESMGQKGDVLLAISTSGNSPNVIKAAEAAIEKGIKIVALTGKTGGLLAKMADAEIRVEWGKYSDRIQEIHVKLIHILVEIIESRVL